MRRTIWAWLSIVFFLSVATVVLSVIWTFQNSKGLPNKKSSQSHLRFMKNVDEPLAKVYFFAIYF
jgi:NADH:ubiquinone oxidoreductase subunit 6 (subunit J)